MGINIVPHQVGTSAEAEGQAEAVGQAEADGQAEAVGQAEAMATKRVKAIKTFMVKAMIQLIVVPICPNFYTGNEICLHSCH